MSSKFARSTDPASSHDAAKSYESVRPSTKAIVGEFLIAHLNDWVNADMLNVVGGRAGDRRMRELRQDGWQIETRRKPGTRTWQHRLVQRPDDDQMKTLFHRKAAA